MISQHSAARARSNQHYIVSVDTPYKCAAELSRHAIWLGDMHAVQPHPAALRIKVRLGVRTEGV